MTSLAFILGVLPLVISSGAGSHENAVGTGVMGDVPQQCWQCLSFRSFSL
ncbi:efflux RND transporter permease subunit [Shigella flexneri]